MKKAMFKTVAFQGIFGLISMAIWFPIALILHDFGSGDWTYFVTYPLASVIAIILSFIMYKFVLKKHNDIELSTAQKNFSFVIAIAFSLLLACCTFVDFAVYPVYVFQQSTFLAFEFSDLFAFLDSNILTYIAVAILFIIENVIKTSILVFHKK